MMQASAQGSARLVNVSSLLEWGDDGAEDLGDIEEPGVISDVFARIGGPDIETDASVDVML